ncbi:alkene reductase [Nesterenkonia halotolerans]|uniref:2,4-dienoyl-CoA reductase-like NADH-dependent reductase (Old Yellow Enzyme family) n=1 Tax=Nesterenkonia halotolerans TaxID=225325 RepID=A0ABR9J8I7_9MICC|nr:alkene reductase [Nesterenkonia halotolerans]MBE1515318.1 2,4-dienoyl-CoA reductase-like NADH-dependent reductase (Old Yellow Enzyme family) [Nesterenkonia halotolerans]
MTSSTQAGQVQDKLFSPLSLGAIELDNRLVMAPLTRIRADADGVPNEMMVEYYTQRASLGLIVTEGTFPVLEGRTWIGQPGLETADQVSGWRRVTDSVHAAGGKIIAQIMHGGRIGHELISGTGRVVAPSALAAPGEIRTPEGKSAHPVPHALSTEEVAETITAFTQASKNAIEAGFDGVQLHGANGYLLHEFTAPASNTRSDQYGGSPENRARLSVEVAASVSAAIGADRTGIRLSPQHNIQGALEEDHEDALATYRVMAEGFAPLGLSHIDVLNADPASEIVQMIRRVSGAPLIANSGFGVQTTREEAVRLVAEDLAEAVGVGRSVIANPDLAHRWEMGLEENEADPSTFYVGGERGYTDYPALRN